MIPSKISKEGADFIRKWEGCKLTAYQDVKGIWTIGYGNTMYPNGISVKKGDTITQAKADELFLSIVSRFESQVSKMIRTDVTQSQYDAIVSLCYNIGIGNFGKSTLLMLLNRNANKEIVSAEFVKWNKSGGKIIAGLTRRREAEKKLFLL